MAKYIPEGIEYVEGLRSMTLTLTTHNAKLINRIAKSVSSSINIFKHKFYIIKTDIQLDYRKVKSAKFELSPQDPSKIDIKKLMPLLQKYGEASFEVKRDMMPFQQHGYVHHEFEKKITLSEKNKVFAKIWDILPNKEKSVWEVVIWKEEEKWCCDCHDEHTFTETISSHQFKDKSRAIGKWGNIIKNKEKYNERQQ